MPVLSASLSCDARSVGPLALGVLSCFWFRCIRLGFGSVVRVELSAVKPDDAISPGLLRHVECIVGGLQHRFPPADLRMRPRRDSKAHSALESAALVGKCMRIDPLPQALGERDSGVENSSWKQQQKFFSAVTPHAVYLACFFRQDVSELLEYFVARRVAVSIVRLS